MNKNIEKLILAVADNKLQEAKQYIKVILANENAACNQWLKNHVMQKLSTPSNNLIELPHSLKGMLSIEDVSVSFNNDRYVLSGEESTLVDKILNIWRQNEKLTEFGIRYLNATLLYGESGCGKTTLGRYIAYTAGLNFAYVNFSHLISSYLGSTGKNIKEIFDYIKLQKCVFMIDELDAIGMERGNSKELGEMSRVVIGLMQALDSLDTGIIVMGATNRYDIIDAALKRRFSLQHEIKKPHKVIRKQLLKSYISTIPDSKINEADLDIFAELTDNKEHSKITDLIVNAIVGCLVLDLEISTKNILEFI